MTKRNVLCGAEEMKGWCDMGRFEIGEKYVSASNREAVVVETFDEKRKARLRFSDPEEVLLLSWFQLHHFGKWQLVP
jgi:hypothetical protein